MEAVLIRVEGPKPLLEETTEMRRAVEAPGKTYVGDRPMKRSASAHSGRIAGNPPHRWKQHRSATCRAPFPTKKYFFEKAEQSLIWINARATL
jgi:hypothetical protein